MNTERRPIPGYQGYEVDTDGAVWSLRAYRGRAEPHRLHPRPGGSRGYPYVSLMSNGRPINRSVHALVALAFLGPRPSGHEVNHRNGNKQDPRPCNLEYVSGAENHAHASRLGLKAHGERNARSKLTVRAVAEIRSRRNERSAALALEFGVHKATINKVLSGYTWRTTPEARKEPSRG